MIYTYIPRYEEFHDRVVCEVEVWPAGVMGCVEEYDRTLCLYLGVNRQPTHSSPVNKRKVYIICRKCYDVSSNHCVCVCV